MLEPYYTNRQIVKSIEEDLEHMPLNYTHDKGRKYPGGRTVDIEATAAGREYFSQLSAHFDLPRFTIRARPPPRFHDVPERFPKMTRFTWTDHLRARRSDAWNDEVNAKRQELGNIVIAKVMEDQAVWNLEKNNTKQQESREDHSVVREKMGHMQVGEEGAIVKVDAGQEKIGLTDKQ